MTSEYESIYSRFYLRVTDYNLAGLDEHMAKEMMNGWMHSTLSKPYVRRLFSQLTIDDDVEELEYELKFPVSDGEDQDFIEEVIVMGMVNSALNTQQMFSNQEQKFYSQANHLEVLQELLHKNQNDQRKLIRDRGYIYNGYITET